MNDLIQADVFFFITTVAVAILTALLAVLIMYILSVIRDVKDISRTVKTETKYIAEDIADLRQHMRTEGRVTWRTLVFFIKKVLFHKRKGTRHGK